MSLTFYHGAGSPYAWRVWLALEHKQIPHRVKPLSFSGGDLKQPEFLALNPRGKVPVIEDGEFVLYESAAILEYLEDAYPDYGRRLFPGSVRQRALVRRMVCEADSYFAPPLNRLLREVLFKPREEWDEARIAHARNDCLEELRLRAEGFAGDFLAGALSAADFTLYPMVALALRCEAKKPDLGLRSLLPPRIDEWMQGVEMLPYLNKTRPANWR